MLFKAEEGVRGSWSGEGSGGRVRAPGPVPRLWTGPLVGLSVIPSPRGATWSGATRVGRGERDQTEGGDHATDAVMTCTITRPPRVRGCSRRRGSGRLRQAADVVIAQAEEDQHDQLAGRCHDTDVAAPAFPDPVAGLPEAGVTALHGLDRGPADQPRALFGDPAAMHGSVGLAMLRVQPGPAGQLRRPREPSDLADLGDEHRRQDGPDPGNGLDREIARVEP